jgi:L1 cell adhesion molecule like protein
MLIKVFEGERAMTKDNYFLGKFELTGIPPAPAGVKKVEDTYEIDTNGILKVTSVETSGGSRNTITITTDKGRLSKEEIERLVKEANIYRAEDEKKKRGISAQNDLQSYCFNMKSAVDEGKLKGKISESDKGTILDKCNEVLRWLDGNRHARKEEFESRLKKLESVCNPVMTEIL